MNELEFELSRMQMKQPKVFRVFVMEFEEERKRIAQQSRAEKFNQIIRKVGEFLTFHCQCLDLSHYKVITRLLLSHLSIHLVISFLEFQHIQPFFKGHIIPKEDWRDVDSPKKQSNEFFFVVVVKSILRESMVPQSAYGFI